VTPPIERRKAAAGSRTMLAMVATMAVILAVAVAALWRETRPRDDVTASIHAAQPSPQTTASYPYHLALLVRERCGEIPTPRLKAASEDEEQDDPELQQQAAAAAQARAATITTWQSCDYVISEIKISEQRLVAGTSVLGH
jgi:hypothetical protein